MLVSPKGKDKTKYVKTIEKQLEAIARHYRRIGDLPEQYRNDPDFKPILVYKKRLPELKKIIKNFLQNPSENGVEQIRRFNIEVKPLLEKFSETAEKYGAGEEIREERHGFPE